MSKITVYFGVYFGSWDPGAPELLFPESQRLPSELLAFLERESPKLLTVFGRIDVVTVSPLVLDYYRLAKVKNPELDVQVVWTDGTRNVVNQHGVIPHMHQEMDVHLDLVTEIVRIGLANRQTRKALT